jgi:ferric-dicitrate binding protein FerR (iron transport regulator)
MPRGSPRTEGGKAMNEGKARDDERLLARAVRDAARLEPASAQARERVRAAVHAQWRASLPATVPSDSAETRAHEAAPRRARWPLALAASVAVALVAGGLSWQVSRPGATLAVAELVRGPVSITSPGLVGTHESALGASAAVAARQVVSTGVDGAALLRLGPGLTLRLAANSRLALTGAGEVSLEAGMAYVDADPRHGTQPLTVATSLGSVRHLGTQYSVSATGSRLEVAVREGRVQWSGSAGREPLEAQSGEALRIPAAGVVERLVVGHDDPRWAWLGALPLPFELQGASLSAFLEWYARESGRAVSFAGPGEAARAREVLLSGSIAGLSPDEALQVVVASAGVTADRDGAQLVLRFR